MTAAQKNQVFQLVQNASAWLNGYVPDDLAVCPEFSDDAVQAPLPEVQPEVTVAPQNESPKPESTGISLDSVNAKISACQNCVLSKTRTHVVPGEGVLQPVAMVIGEGPGEDEDISGRPFVGKAGQLLDKMLASIALSRASNCFIANIVKCRPPMNRTPMPDEANACSGYLQAQIHILKPQLILAMGRTAIQNLLQTEKGINALRGQFFDYNGIPVIATYHPSALLRDEALKRPAWEDLKKARTKLAELCPDYAAEFYRMQNKA